MSCQVVHAALALLDTYSLNEQLTLGFFLLRPRVHQASQRALGG